MIKRSLSLHSARSWFALPRFEQQAPEVKSLDHGSGVSSVFKMNLFIHSLDRLHYGKILKKVEIGKFITTALKSILKLVKLKFACETL